MINNINNENICKNFHYFWFIQKSEFSVYINIKVNHIISIGSNYDKCLTEINKILKKNLDRQISIVFILNVSIDFIVMNDINIFSGICELVKYMKIDTCRIWLYYGVYNEYYFNHYTSIDKFTKSRIFIIKSGLKTAEKLKMIRQNKINNDEKIKEINKIRYNIIRNINDIDHLFPCFVDDKCVYRYFCYMEQLNHTNKITLNNCKINTIEHLIDIININIGFIDCNFDQKILLNIKNMNKKVISFGYNFDSLLNSRTFKNYFTTIILSNNIIKNKIISKIYLHFKYKDEKSNYHIPKLLIPLIRLNLKNNNLDKLTFANIKIIDNQNILTFLKYYKYINNRKNYEKYNKINLIKLLFILRYFDVSNELIFIMLKYYQI